MTNAANFPVPAQGYRAVCFDLDGTLLPMDLDAFLGAYFEKLARFMVARGVNGEVFKKALNDGVKAMIKNKGPHTNAEVFWELFFRELAELMEGVGEENLDNDKWLALFNEFYEGPFATIGEGVEKDEHMVHAVHALQEKEYPILLTTMPLFPIQALAHRCDWSGLNVDDFCRLTTFENSTAAKPSLHYYAENLAAMGVSGKDVLMVGNNTVEDYAFTQLGADIYLVTDHLLDPVDFDMSTVRNGTTAEFAAWVDALPSCENPIVGVNTGCVDAAATDDAYRANLVATPEELAAAKEAAARARSAADDIGDAIAEERGKDEDTYVPHGMEHALNADFSAKEE